MRPSFFSCSRTCAPTTTGHQELLWRKLHKPSKVKRSNKVTERARKSAKSFVKKASRKCRSSRKRAAQAVTKPTPWRGEMQVTEDEAQDAKMEERLKEKFDEWKPYFNKLSGY